MNPSSYFLEVNVFVLILKKYKNRPDLNTKVSASINNKFSTPRQSEPTQFLREKNVLFIVLHVLIKISSTTYSNDKIGSVSVIEVILTFQIKNLLVIDKK